MFSFAGIYKDSGFAILATRPNKLMEDVHDRMPCILTAEEEDRWLNHDTSADELVAMLRPFPDELMKRWRCRHW